jgi:hypothetical protein
MRELWGRQVLCRSAGSPSCQELLSVLQTSARRTPCLFNITDVSSSQDWGNSAVTNSQLQNRACAALASLVLLDDNKVKIEAAGGSGCIATAICSHPTNSELQYTACAALASLVLLDDDKVKIEAVGGIECITAAMRRYPTNSRYKTWHVRRQATIQSM